jgi:DNA repair exonuclease SbcCD ATPase subunit
MKITRLEIVDFKRIEAAAIDADTGKPIVLTGDNGQGKTSVLDAVMFALTRSGTEKPIRNGAESATVALTLTDGTERVLTVRRKMKGANAYLDVSTQDGAKMPSPQKFLDSLIGNLAFDPEAFTRLKPKEQADALRIAVGLDTSDLDADHKLAYAQRTEANRVKDNAEKLYKAAPVVSGQPLEPKSASLLVKERDALRAEVDLTETAQSNLEDIADDICATQATIKTLEEKLATAKADLAKMEEDEKALAAALDKRRDATRDHATKITAINEALAGIDEHNKNVENHNRQIREREQLRESYQTALKRATDLDNEVKRIQSEKEQRIAAAKFPIPGLTIEDDTVLVGGVPFSDLNTAERIKVSTMIAMSQNPELKVIFVREGALVSRANLAVLTKLAEQNDCQLWLEVFSEDPHDDSLHITDGHISHINGEPAPAQQLELV